MSGTRGAFRATLRELTHGEPTGAVVAPVLLASAAIALVASPIAMRMCRKER